jgi:hypothetical protein
MELERKESFYNANLMPKVLIRLQKPADCKQSGRKQTAYQIISKLIAKEIIMVQI